MEDRTPDGTPTVDLGASEASRASGAPPVKPASAFDPPKERFEAVGELGRGGMGRVDDAYDRALGRPVAIKHMLSTSDVALGRFEREARITARLEHPGIVPIHDAGRGPDGTPYYVMRRVDGKPLDAALGDTLASRLALIPNVLAACDAVAFAHARGVVHRDIKPTNILVGPFGETLVIDWGLAREIGEPEDRPAIVEPSDPQLTVAGTIAGTPGFMAPEQARGEAVDARADVFALGATLFYVLSGELPYGAASATEMVDLAGAGRMPHWRAIPKDVPPELRAIAVKAMASEAGERYVDAGALAADLRRFITGNLVGAYEYSPLARFARFVRRHRGAVAVALVSAVVVTAIAVLSIRRIVSERDDATTARALAETRQHETASMRDRLLVENALALANTDPIAAVSTLRTLAPDSSHWPEARVAAAQAFVRGIPFGFAGDAGVGYIQIHRDSKLVAIGNLHDGQIAIIDLVARTRRVLKTSCASMIAVVWLGPTHVVCATASRIVVIDIATDQTRELPVAVAGMLGNHDSLVWVTTKTKQLVQLDSPTGDLRELATGFDDFDVSPLLDEAVFRRGTAFEVWSGADRIHLQLAIAEHPNMTSMTIRDHRLVILENDHVHAYRLEGARAVPIEGFLADQNYVSLNIIGSKFYFETGAGLAVYDDGRHVATDATHGISFPVPRGIVRILNNGAFFIIDRDGEFRIERRASAIRRVDVSIDGRFVVTLGESGETLVWDLSKVRPKRIWLDNGTSVTRVTKHYVWTMDLFDGIRRVPVTTGVSEPAVPLSVTGNTLVGEDERWAAVEHMNQIHIVDFTTGHRFAFDGVASDDGVGVTFLKPDRTLWRWRPGSDRATQLATLERMPQFFDAVPDFLGVLYDDDVLERRRVATGAIERTTVPHGSRFGMLDDGTLWVRKPDGSVVRWEVGGAPTKFDLGGPLDDLVVDHDRVAMYSRRGMTLLVGTRRYFSPIGSSTFGWAGKTTAITTNVGGEPMITDLTTGLGYQLPTAAFLGVQPPVGLDNVFAIIVTQTRNKTGLDLWTVDVPEDPPALRAWLATITNATPVAGTTSYQWP